MEETINNIIVPRKQEFLMVNKIIVPHKQDFLMEKLSIFYKNREYLDKILPIIHGKSSISLRIIDWFITNYAKKYNTRIISFNENKKQHQFIVYINYKSQLKAYTKKQFDPFCRRERIRFFYNKQHENNESDFIITTVGQLNFFRWAIEHNIIEYITNNLKDIEIDMNTCVKKIKNNQKNKRKKRQELSISATKSINKHNIEIVVNFD